MSLAKFAFLSCLPISFHSISGSQPHQMLTLGHFIIMLIIHDSMNDGRQIHMWLLERK